MSMAGHVLLSLCVVFTLSKAAPSYRHGQEVVFLRDLKMDHDRRHLETGLPSQLDFVFLKREREPVRLRLTENKRLNANAPVFNVHMDQTGQQQLVKKNSKPITDMKFYQDMASGGAFQVKCLASAKGPCRRAVTGNFHIAGKNYDIKPVHNPTFGKRGTGNTKLEGAPHLLVENSVFDVKKFADFKYPPGSRSLTTADGDYSHDYKVPPNDGTFHQRSSDTIHTGDKTNRRLILTQKLRDVLSDVDMDRIAQILTQRQKRQEPELYALELIIVIDPSLWKKYYDTTTKTDEMTREEATEYLLRQRYVHIVNGMSLRYEEIEDPGMDIYLTLSGFIIYKEIDSSNPLPLSVPIPVVNGVQHADSDVYLDNMVSWLNNIKGLPNNDHIALFSGYELYYDGDPSNDDVVGVAWLNGVCNKFRVSVNEDRDYFITTNVAAHELGHNLGANHDGNEKSKACSADSNYIMAPYVASFDEGHRYSINPWRFSVCSVEAFKSYVHGLSRSTFVTNCLLDGGNLYNDTEYKKHSSLLPGERYGPDKQCQLINREESKLCTSSTSEEICQVMGCGSQSCYSISYYAAAIGTPCGNTEDNKWCMEGKCVTRPVIQPTDQPSSAPITVTSKSTTPKTPMPSTAATSQTPGSTKQTTRRTTSVSTPWMTSETSTTADDCVDISYYDCASSVQYYGSLDNFCTFYQTECCATCRGEGDDETDCVDSPYYHCESGLKEFNNDDEWFCANYGSECCETCKGVGNNIDDGDTCFDVQEYDCPNKIKFYDSEEQFCGYYEVECCDTCSHVDVTDTTCKDDPQYNCETERRMYDNGKQFCNDYGDECCETCSEHENGDDECDDNPNYDCKDEIQYYSSDDKFCELFGTECCKTCQNLDSGEGDCRNDPNYNCETNVHYYNSKEEFCDYFDQECCETCSDTGSGDDKCVNNAAYYCDSTREIFDSHEEFCNYLEKECCEICSNKPDENECVDQIQSCNKMSLNENVVQFCKNNHYGDQCCGTCLKHGFAPTSKPPCNDKDFCEYYFVHFYYENKIKFCEDGWGDWCCSTCY